MTDRLKHWVKLKSAPGLGFQTSLRLLQTYGAPENWTKETLATAFRQRFLIETAYDYLASDCDPEGWKQICDLLEHYDISYTTLLDEDYPALLGNIYSPPLILYYRGDLSAALNGNCLGVVGTRKPSEYGRSMTAAIVEPLAAAGVTIISGLAYGIDTSAHKAALKGNGRTVAVLAQGLDTVYPPQNQELAQKILATGALVSEYEPGSRMERWNFPARNRIISGLSNAVLVTEGSITSGALLTAKFALEQNREIYALPGQVNLSNAEGPNHLIKNGARLVTSAEDIMRDFNIDLKPSDQLDLFPELTESEQQVYDLFRQDQKDFSFDELIYRTGWSIGQISIVLLNLELKDLLLKAGGNTFSLK
jgi:DNA processing protein